MLFAQMNQVFIGTHNQDYIEKKVGSTTACLKDTVGVKAIREKTRSQTTFENLRAKRLHIALPSNTVPDNHLRDTL